MVDLFGNDGHKKLEFLGYQNVKTGSYISVFIGKAECEFLLYYLLAMAIINRGSRIFSILTLTINTILNKNKYLQF